jgi:acetyl-CoA synthetase
MSDQRTPSSAEISALLTEERRFPPPDAFRAQANWNDQGIYAHAGANPEAFWAEQARQLEWMQPFTKVLEWNAPDARWFTGGKLNAAVNCVDRHVREGRRNKAALIWEGEPGDSRTLTYFDLQREVNRFANVLKSFGVKKGDVVAMYMPLVPELAIGMLACARIGAVHSVVFGGFSAEALADRINDAKAKVLVTADGGYRRGQLLALKKIADAALEHTPSIENVLVVKRDSSDRFPIHIKEGRDHWYHRIVQDVPAWCEPEPMDSEDMLYILYTSGTTGKPKGIVHTTAGYLTGTMTTSKYVFDLKDDDVYWCTADIGWVTGHSYVVYGPLACGATCLMYEGAPDWPERDRFWSLIEKYGVTIFYTAPTAIRAFMRWGTELPAARDLSSLRLLGSVGEPINPEAWMWYHEHIGRERCPIVDTWWQTETGMIMITPLPGITTTTPGSATHPFPGISIEIRKQNGEPVTEGGGLLTISKPWPAMLRGIFGDRDRFVSQYWQKWEDGAYFAGDGARVDAEGFVYLLGRVDDVLNISGHRLGTAEIESALVDHKAVAEAAVVGKVHDIKGHSIAAFVTLKEGQKPSTGLVHELKEHVVKKIGALARPEDIHFAADLPKTRSGKIMRRLLRDIADGKAIGDTTTLADPAVVAKLKAEYETQEE